MGISEGGPDVIVPEYFFHYPDITSFSNHDCGWSVPGKYMHSTMLLYSGFLFVGYKNSINVPPVGCVPELL